MKAIYKGKLYTMDGDSSNYALLGGGAEEESIFVPYSDPDLIIDPTDDEVEEARANAGYGSEESEDGEAEEGRA